MTERGGGAPQDRDDRRALAADAAAAGSILVLGYGNPGRCDDGLGPALAERVAGAGLPRVHARAVHQLAVEDALAVADHDLVVFADASLDGAPPFEVRRLEPGGRGAAFTSHLQPPGGVLGLARSVLGGDAVGYTLAVRGHRFRAFGEELTPGAADNLEHAVSFLTTILGPGDGAAAPPDRATRARRPTP